MNLHSLEYFSATSHCRSPSQLYFCVLLDILKDISRTHHEEVAHFVPTYGIKFTRTRMNITLTRIDTALTRQDINKYLKKLVYRMIVL